MRLPPVIRVQQHHLPSIWTKCGTLNCIYNVGGLCDMPAINKGNSDARCHRESNRSLLARLEPVGPADEAGAPAGAAANESVVQQKANEQ